jgi:glucose/arabinose dehydrogenase
MSDPRRAILIGILGAVLVACASTPTPTVPVAPTPSAGEVQSPSLAPSPSPSSGSGTADLTVRLDRVVAGLNSPLAVVNAGDDSGRLFVVEQPGLIRIVKDGVLLDAPFLDITRRIQSGNEEGLLGLAFAPGFPRDPRLYVDYTNLEGNSVIASFHVPSSTPNQADPASERILLQFDQPFPNHNGGGLAFGPDDDLYIAAGDGGSEGDPMGNGQNLDTYLGKLLRIRPGTSDHTPAPYTIPPDAPFLGRIDAKPEIRAFGLRNPWRFSFDRETGDLWIGDVGQEQWEEVDVIRKSDPPNVAPNFGWNVMEGQHCYNAETCAEAGLTLPVAEYGHDDGSCAIIGGYVDRDPAEPRLAGNYLYGDSCSGDIWMLDPAHPEASEPTPLIESGRSISSFGEDQAGALYVTDLASGELLRVSTGP